MKKTEYDSMITLKIITDEKLGITFHYWNDIRKNERIYFAKEIMEQLGYKGGVGTLKNRELEEGIDKINVEKRKFPEFFKIMVENNLIGLRAGNITLLYESGLIKLLINSRKKSGILVRDWLSKSNILNNNVTPFIINDKNNTNSYTYIIYDDSKELYKIGFTNDYCRRYKEIYSNNIGIEIIMMIEGNHENGLHNFFQSKRVELEWFKLSNDDLFKISKLYGGKIFNVSPSLI